jgi:hypothetical protein
LTSYEGEVVYAPLELVGSSSGSQDGADLYVFRAELTFEGMNDVLPFSFDGQGRDTRPIDAVFIDRDGLVGMESTQVVAMGAPGCGGQLCGGECVDTLSDVHNCGGCGVVCPPNNQCVQGACQYQGSAGWSSCLTPSAAVTCASHCASLNRTCSPACGVLVGTTDYDGLTVHEYLNEACTKSEGGTAGLHDSPAACNTPLSQFGAEAIKCCCF